MLTNFFLRSVSCSFIFFLFLLVGCSVPLVPLTSDQIDDFATDNFARITEDQEPLEGPITLYEAMARAIKYNLDYRVEITNSLLSYRNYDLSRADLLPSIVSSGGWSFRNNSDASLSRSLSQSSTNLSATSSQDDGSFMGNITLSWDILDFGLSYIRAHQSADEVLISNERRRRVISGIIEDVRSAYWRAVSAERLIDGFEKLRVRAEKALKASRALYSSGDSSPISALTYQRELIDIRRQIHRLEQDLRTTKIQLSALMNIRPDTDYRLHIPKRRLSDLSIDISAESLITHALRHRPELLELGYQERINERESRAALLEILPSISGTLGFHSDRNRFLVNEDWVSHGAQVGLNLLRVFSYPRRRSVIKTQEQLLDDRALATSMAIMVQVYVALARYDYSYNSAVAASEYYAVQRQLRDRVRSEVSAQSSSEQSLISEEMSTLVAAVQYDLAYSDLQSAFASIYTSIGADPHDDDITIDMTISELSSILQKTWEARGDKHLNSF